MVKLFQLYYKFLTMSMLPERKSLVSAVFSAFFRREAGFAARKVEYIREQRKTEAEETGMRDEEMRERFLSSEEIYPGRIIRVEKWQMALPNGQAAMREIVRHNGASAIVPVDEMGRVTLVRQYRVPIDECTWEIPAGKLDSPTEDPFRAAQRELEEETGLQAEAWRHLTTMYTTPGVCTEKIAIYLATNLSQHPAHPDEDEFLDLNRLPLSEAVAMCMDGRIRDSKTMVGLLLAHRALYAQDTPFFGARATPIQRPAAVSSSRE